MTLAVTILFCAAVLAARLALQRRYAKLIRELE